MNNELSLRSTKNKRRKYTEIELAIKEANSLYVKNDLDQCIIKTKNILSRFPRCDRAYFLLGLIFEEKKDIIKAYNFYMIAAQLMKNNYELWSKLYTLAGDLNLFSDKLYFIQIIQRYKNSRDLVIEKMGLYKMLKNKYKALECKIELFEFDGIDFEIFGKIRNETKHKIRTSILATCLIRYYKKNPKACGIEYLMNCIRLQYDSGYLIGTKDLLEKFIFPDLVIISNDIRIIYIVCCLAANTTDEEAPFKGEYKTNEVDSTKANEFDYGKISEKIFSSTKSILDDFDTNKSFSKTLKLDTFDQTEQLELFEDTKYEKYSDLNIFLSDDNFWNSFREENEIKPLIEVLIDLNMLDYATKLITKLLSVCSSLNEFCNLKLGEISCLLDDYNMASVYFEKVLQINPDNVIVKSKLYNIYQKLGNKDMSSHYKTVNSLISYVDDISNKEKKDYRFSLEDCQQFRDLYCESRRMFGIDFKEHIKITRPLIDDFLKNEFIFIQSAKFKNFMTADDRKIESLKGYKFAEDDPDKKAKIIENVRHLSLHGLDTDEWFYVLFEYITSKIENRNYSEASFLLRRCLIAHLFVKRKDLIMTLFLFSVKHGLHNNDLVLLTYSFKKIIPIFGNYNLSHYFFYLANYFIEPQIQYAFGKFMRNIRRYFSRSYIENQNIIIDNTNTTDATTLEESSSITGNINDSTQIISSKNSFAPYKFKVDPLCYLNTFLNKSVFTKTYKDIGKIRQPLSINEEILKTLIYVIACKSRNNNEKDSVIKFALKNLVELCGKVKGEQKFAIVYNIGKVYDMLGYIGYAERYYKEAYQTSNRELKRMIRFNLILIYKKNNNSTLLEKYYEDDLQ
ncbi:transcription factor TAU-like protein [Nosema bombycis CQ1]|uniref:Transcription factor TAU-like protein n=1 Tax=Nosema bombycis (strain CQ1 / CVCC 102059) TaxID=578461 RepID=R0MKZ7_NOSB1|nr:transcription factor TAU-like protein [Nosema bombycis CQ1]|eukprot:EOB14880.1 transcription factor TAU-like protein [Nosema bombycis CQ1]